MSQTTRIPDFKLPFAEAGHYLSDLVTPTLRLGVTGLSRSGKTVFITGLVQALINQNAEPAFKSLSRAPGFRCYLEPQPDDDVPRFSYEDHLAALDGGSPLWPDSTRRISQLRLTLEWEAQDFARQIVGLPYRLHIDIIDYPGEWLIDLGLLDQSFEQWSAEAIGYARSNRKPSISEPFLAFCKNYSGHEEAAESVAIEGAKLFTAYLTAARRADPSRSVLGPGRFLLPGDLQDSPLITFNPRDHTFLWTKAWKVARA
ncbi:MAG: YcjX family protein [Pseudomonadota bacterium]